MRARGSCASTTRSASRRPWRGPTSGWRISTRTGWQVRSDPSSADDGSAPGDDDLLEADVPAAFRCRRQDHVGQHAAAGDLHPDDNDLVDRVVPQDGGYLLEAGPVIELGASYDYRVPVEEHSFEIVEDECGAIGGEHERLPEEIGFLRDQSQLDRPVVSGVARGDAFYASSSHDALGRIDEADGALWADRKAVPQAVAEIPSEERCLPVDYGQGSFVTGCDAESASVAFLRIDDDLLSEHDHEEASFDYSNSLLVPRMDFDFEYATMFNSYHTIHPRIAIVISYQ